MVPGTWHPARALRGSVPFSFPWPLPQVKLNFVSEINFKVELTTSLSQDRLESKASRKAEQDEVVAVADS